MRKKEHRHYRQILNSSFEGWGHFQPDVQDLRKARRRRCLLQFVRRGIAAKALNPFYANRRKKSPRPDLPRP